MNKKRNQVNKADEREHSRLPKSEEDAIIRGSGHEDPEKGSTEKSAPLSEKADHIDYNPEEDIINPNEP